MPSDSTEAAGSAVRLLRVVDRQRDRIRGDGSAPGAVSLVLYGDYLCPYCRRFGQVIRRLRETLGDRFVYVFRHFPNEDAHPGAIFAARAAEAAGEQGEFWQMHDRLYGAEPSLGRTEVLDIAQSIGLDMARFESDLESERIAARVEEDRADGRRNGVTGTPTYFINGLRYDGAWDFYSILEALELPVAVRVHRSARVFASLPAAGGLVLLFAAVVALVCANTALAPYYQSFMESSFNIGPPGNQLSLTTGGWLSEGLLAIFFLLVGLEIRREIMVGALAELRAVVLPVVAAIGGVVVPALIYLALNRGSAAVGWAVPTATDIAFTLGILALMGDRVSPGLRVFVAALAIVDDVISVVTLGIFYPREISSIWLAGCGSAVVLLLVLNRARVRAGWPYAVIGVLLWLSLHATGVHAALAGILLAAFLPTRPAPAAGPLLAQAATALAELEYAETAAEKAGGEVRRIHQEPLWDWASRNLSAASERLLSPADRLERALSPWSAYLILPLFAFSSTGISLDVDLSSPAAGGIVAGVVAGLVLGKPLGILLASLLAVKLRFAVLPDGVTARNFIGAACLCGVGYTVALLMANEAFTSPEQAAVAKAGVLLGSTIAGVLGVLVFLVGRRRP
jgi:NhaA family Na+:H+ antiporter